MKGKDLQRFKAALLRQKADLLNKSTLFKEESQKGKDFVGDEADVATTEIHMNMDIRLRERERVLVHKIETALAKIADGSYGLCQDCNEPMDLKRLFARPVATLCIACKEDQEDMEKIYAHA